MKAIDLLRAAHGRLAVSERAWTQEEYARDLVGRPTDPRAEACSYCAVGALLADQPDSPEWTGAAHRALVALASIVEPHMKWEPVEDVSALMAEQAVAEWNDALGRTRAEVLEVFDRAIALLEEKGGEA